MVDDAVEPIVQTLLQVGDRVVEVSRGQVMVRIWDRPGSPLSIFKNYYEGKRVAEIRNDTTIDYAVAAIEKAFVTRQNSYAEYVSYNNDNNGIATYSLRVLACHPNPNFVFMVVENISNGKEHMLIEDKWKLALDASEQGVWDVNLENNTIFFSDKWEDLFGYSTKEIESIDDWREKVFPEDRDTAATQMEAYFSGRTPIYTAEVRYRCKDGSYKWILSRGVVITRKPDGTPVRFIGTHTDISAQKQAEEDLRLARDTFANSFNYSGIGKALIAPGGKWLEVNNIVCQLTGYSREELYNLHYRDITFPDDVDIDLPLIQKLLAREIPSYTIEKRYVTKDRVVLTTNVTVTLVWNSENKPLYFVCDIVDRTKKKAIMEELKRKNSELETTSANLHSRIKQIEELNNIVAHNLRGPAGNIKMLSEQSGLFTDEEALPMIHVSSIALLESLDTMVEAARIKLDKEVEYEDCSFNELIDNITGQLQGIIYQQKINLIRNIGVAQVRYPKIYLESILYNLVSNAIKYSKADVPLVIEITTVMAGDRVQLSVKDNGEGIDLERFGSKVFKLNQVFHQGRDSKGVGLFITKTQVESLGGSIAVKSEPGEGSEFIVTL